MTMYWVYELPNWLFGALTVAAFIAVGLAGLYLTRGWVRRLHKVDHSHNDVVGFYLAAVTVFYGITLGSVGNWHLDYLLGSAGKNRPRGDGAWRSLPRH